MNLGAPCNNKDLHIRGDIYVQITYTPRLDKDTQQLLGVGRVFHDGVAYGDCIFWEIIESEAMQCPILGVIVLDVRAISRLPPHGLLRRIPQIFV